MTPEALAYKAALWVKWPHPKCRACAHNRALEMYWYFRRANEERDRNIV